MNITQREEKGVTIFVLDGRADNIGAKELETTLQAAVQQGHYKMVLDLANLQYINSASLRILADVLTQNRNNKGDLRLVALNPKVERVFKIIGFDKFFDVFNTIEDALYNF